MVIFNKKENEYRQWLKNNPDGFVINAPKQGTAVANMLHKARCGSISTDARDNFTTNDYMKICSEDKQELLELIAWAKKENNFGECKLCNP